MPDIVASHVAAETLALLAEGLLDSDEAHSVQAHLSECATCAELSNELTEVSAALAQCSFPELSEATAARLDAALNNPELIAAAPIPDPALASDGPTDTDTEESDSGDGSGPTAVNSVAGEHKAPVVSLDERRLRRPNGWMPYLVAAAAAVFVFGGTIALVGNVWDTSKDEGDIAAPQAPEDGEAAQPYEPPRVVQSGIQYTETELTNQTIELIERSELPVDADGAGEGPDGSAPLADASVDVSAVETCTTETAGDGDGSLYLIDDAEYEAEPAWVMLFTEPDATTPEGYRVQVHSPGCVATDGGAEAEPMDEAYIPVEEADDGDPAAEEPDAEEPGPDPE